MIFHISHSKYLNGLSADLCPIVVHASVSQRPDKQNTSADDGYKTTIQDIILI